MIFSFFRLEGPAPRDLARCFLGFPVFAFGASEALYANDFATQSASSFLLHVSGLGRATYSRIGRPGMASNNFALFAANNSSLTLSGRRRIKSSWNSPMNKFPFTKPAG